MPLEGRPTDLQTPHGSLGRTQSALLALITGREAAPSLTAGELIVSDQRAGAQERLAIYACMYQARVAEALGEQFPRLARHLGPEAFADLASAYIADRPSRHPSLRFIGERLSVWLEAHRPALAGLARLEWTRADVFDLADETTLTVEAARAWPADRFAELPLRRIAASRLVTTPAGTGALWEGESSAPGGDGVETLLVWRQGVTVYHRLVDPFERAALELTDAGTPLGALCDALLALRDRALEDEQIVGRVHAWLSTWVADGVLAAPPEKVIFCGRQVR